MKYSANGFAVSEAEVYLVREKDVAAELRDLQDVRLQAKPGWFVVKTLQHESNCVVA